MRKNIESTCSGEIGCTVHVDFVIPVRLDSVTKGPFSVGCRSAIWSRFSVASNRRREIVGRLIRSARSSYDRASRFILRETIAFCISKTPRTHLETYASLDYTKTLFSPNFYSRVFAGDYCRKVKRKNGGSRDSTMFQK